MSSAPTTPTGRDAFGMTADDRHRLKTQTEAEITAAALADPDAQPASPEQLARGGRPLAKVVRHKLKMSREEFSAAYGVPLEALIAWERQQAQTDCD